MSRLGVFRLLNRYWADFRQKSMEIDPNLEFRGLNKSVSLTEISIFVR